MAMAEMPDSLRSRDGTQPRWKPPIWLLVLDGASLLALTLGLLMQFSPESAIARALPPAAKLPLLVIGGAAFALCWFALVRSVLGSLRRR